MRSYKAGVIRMKQTERVYKQVLAWILSVGLTTQPGVWAANTVAIPDANQSRHPMVSESANGVTIVDIRRPNDKGLSHNQYHDLQVGDKGLIFNNSQTIVDTKLAGLIKGNPALAGTQANTILNEVTGPKPTSIRGALEIAGPRANLIIANPNGLYVNNGTFINTNRAVLTTGTPIIKNGELTDVAIKGGTIEIAGQGLDARNTSATDILAAATRINAGVWADSLRVVTGHNTVGLNTDTVKKDSDHPEVGLDVAAIGGMYANRITMVGTEKGLGVNLEGTVTALNGSVAVTSDGHVSMKSKVKSHKDMTIQAPTISIDTTGQVGGAGVTIQTQQLQNQGQLVNTDKTKTLAITAQSVDTTKGKITSAGEITVKANEVTNTAGQIATQGSVTLTAQTIKTDTGTIASQQDVTIQTKELAANEATISGDGNVTVTTNTLTGSDTTIEGGQTVHVATQSDTTLRGGRIAANDTIQIESAGHLTNETDIVGQRTVALTAKEVTNSGKIEGQSVQVTSEGNVSNTGLMNGEQMAISSDTLHNTQQGRIYGDTIHIQANRLDNIGTYQGVAPVIMARNDLVMGVGTLTNTEQGLIKAERNVSIGRTIMTDGLVHGAADSIQNRSATLDGGANVVIATQSLLNENLHYTTKKEEIGREQHLEVSAEGYARHISVTNLPYYPDGATPPPTGVAVVNREDDQLYFADGHPDAPTKHYFETWYKYEYDRVIIADVVDTTAPGRIIAGADMQLTGSSLVNDKSELIAGGTLTVRGTTVKNIDPEGTKTYYDTGTMTRYSRQHHHGRDSTNVDPSDYSHTEALTHIVPMTNYGSGKQSAVTTSQSAPYTTPDGHQGLRILPSALYVVAPDVTAGYYIETDPAYTNRHQFLSSAYFLEALQADPDRTAKRLGDGYYEMQLVKDQLLNLTGQRYVGSYASEEDQYKSLLNAAVAFAKESKATIGVALTPAQQAQLKEPLVWMLETTVLLPNGQVVTALVPQVYVTKAMMDEHNPHVAVISGKNIDIEATNEILNTGTVVAGDVGVLSATNINNVKGTLRGQSLGLRATDSIHNLGGTIEAVKALSIVAGNDITVTSTTRTIKEAIHSGTMVDSLGSLRVTGEHGTLAVQAGRDVQLQGALVENRGIEGQTVVQAGRDLRLDTVTTDSRLTWEKDNRNRRYETQSADVGSVVAGQGAIAMVASRDVTMRAASVASAKDVAVSAGRDLAITTGRATTGLQEDYYLVGQTGGGGRQVNSGYNEEYTDMQLQSTMSGKTVTLQGGNQLAITGAKVTAGNDVTLAAAKSVTVSGSTDTRRAFGEAQERKSGLLSKEATDTSYRSKSEMVQKSQISGETISIQSGQDVTITASDVVAKGNMAVSATGHITATTMKEQQETQVYSQTKKSGFSLSGIGISYGTEKLKTTQREAQTTPVGSTIASLEGSTTLTAGQNVQATSAVIAGKTGVAIQGQNVTLDGAYATYEAHTTMDYKKSGLTISLGGVVPQALSTAAANIRQGNSREDKRLTVLEYGEAARELHQGLESVKAYSAYTPQALITQYTPQGVITSYTGVKAGGEVLLYQGNLLQDSLPGWGSPSTELVHADEATHIIQGNIQMNVANEVDIANASNKVKKEKDTTRDALINLQIGISSQSASQQQDIRQTVYQAGTVASEAGRIVITATGKTPDSGHITAIGETIRGRAVALAADTTVHLDAATNTIQKAENSHNQGWSAGVSVGVTGLLGANVSANQGKAVTLTNATTHTGTTVTGTDAVAIQSGRDVVMTGSALTGKRVDVTAGGDLQITSAQDMESYKEDRKQAGFPLFLIRRDFLTLRRKLKKGRHAVPMNQLPSRLVSMPVRMVSELLYRATWT